MANILGTILDSSGAPRRVDVVFHPLSTPIVDGATIVTTTTPKVVASLADGSFVISLAEGDYRVVIDIDEIQISVPNDDDDHNLVTLIIDDLIYQYPSPPSSLIPPATADQPGAVRTNTSAGDPVVYRKEEVDALLAAIPAGEDGRTVLNGSGAPSAGTGVIDDFYIQTTGWLIFGPKTSGGWGVGTSIIGAAGSAGAAGTDGRTILHGSGAPGSGLGVTDDFYIDETNWQIYGPKSGAAWGSGTNIVGPTGATGSAGADGKTVLNGAGAPGGGTGVDGDFYIDTTNNRIYGPKASGAWGGYVSLVGPTGATGATGPSGVPYVMAKKTSTYSATDSDKTIVCNFGSNGDITLPVSSVTDGHEYTVIRTGGAGTVTVKDGNANQLRTMSVAMDSSTWVWCNADSLYYEISHINGT